MAGTSSCLLGQYFPEIRRQLAQQTCQFKDCLHLQEPNCAVSDDWERYEIYQKFLAEAIAYKENQQQQRDAENQLKVKMTSTGKQHEPKLATKKYRRSSRRERQQNLKDLYEKQAIDDLFLDD